LIVLKCEVSLGPVLESDRVCGGWYLLTVFHLNVLFDIYFVFVVWAIKITNNLITSLHEQAPTRLSLVKLDETDVIPVFKKMESRY
jgi:hypothetical protein